MTTQEIETSYRQAIISHIAEQDIKEIKSLITSNINFQKDIDKMIVEKTQESIYKQYLTADRRATSTYINKRTNKIKEFENYIKGNILNIKKIISTRNERIKLYL